MGGERGRVINPKSYMTSLSATDWKDPPKTVKRFDMKIGIKQATKDGIIEIESGGVCDLAYPSSSSRRGRVQRGM